MEPGTGGSPIPRLAGMILAASQECAEQVLKLRDDQDNYEDFLILMEFLYFFMHMTNRIGLKVLGHDHLVALQRELGPLVAQRVTESCLTTSDRWAREDFKRTLFEGINVAEREYADCASLLDEASPFAGNGLFSLLARRTAEQAGVPWDVTVMTAVLSITPVVLKEAGFPALIDAARPFS